VYKISKKYDLILMKFSGEMERVQLLSCCFSYTIISVSVNIAVFTLSRADSQLFPAFPYLLQDFNNVYLQTSDHKTFL